jgi:nucleoside-diphosphate-sugar epimerase
MRILVTGGSSFVGAHFCRLAAERHEVKALCYSTPLRLNGVTPLRLDLRRDMDVARLQRERPDLVVHLACKVKGSPKDGRSGGEVAAELNRQMMDAVLGLGRPVVYASSTVVHWTRDTAYGRSRRDDEARLVASGLPYAILRPSAPYGRRLPQHQPRHKESFHTLAELVRRLPLVPVIGDGKYRRQPIHVDDFSRAMLHFIEQGLPNKAYDAGGAEALTMDEIVGTIAEAMHRHVRPLHLPKALFVQIARRSPDFDPELISAADEDEVADPTELSRAIGWTPRSFHAGARDLS